MALDNPDGLQGCSPDDIRWLDNLDPSLREIAERVSDPGRIRVHGAVSACRNHFHTVRAWTILGITASFGSAAATTLISRGRW